MYKAPDLYLRERAISFNVSISAMSKAMRKLGFVKKTAPLFRALSNEKAGVLEHSTQAH